MGISIKNEQTERLARELARETGESLTTAIRRALEERLERVEGRRSPADRLALARAALRRVDALPVLDERTADEILGYDEHGVALRLGEQRRKQRRGVDDEVAAHGRPCSSRWPRPTRCFSRPAVISRRRSWPFHVWAPWGRPNSSISSTSS